MADEKVMITAALTGGMHDKRSNPNLPEQPEEIAQAAYDCWSAGAAMVHLHARDLSGKVTGDPSIYKRIHSLIRDRCDLVLCDTTGGGPGLIGENRIRVLGAQPEVASLNMGTMVHTSSGEPVWLNKRTEIEEFARRMQVARVKPEMEVYSHSMLVDVDNLISKRLVSPPYFINLVFGMRYQGALPGQPKYLLSLLAMLPPETVFNVTGVGRAQLPLTTISMLLGGHVRVGLEDNIYYSRGQLATGNAQLVERAVRYVHDFGLEIASPQDARRILGLSEPQARLAQ